MIQYYTSRNRESSESSPYLYEGTMKVSVTGYLIGTFSANDFTPTVDGLTYIYVDGAVSVFIANYPTVGDDITRYEFGGTVYETGNSLESYLYTVNNTTISLKVLAE